MDKRINFNKISELCANLPLTNETRRSFEAMHQRCTNPKATGYHNYGGRGITVCERWNDYQAFIEDMGYRPSKDLSIERINNELGYNKDNCKWATRKEQANNKRASIKNRVNTMPLPVQ